MGAREVKDALCPEEMEPAHGGDDRVLPPAGFGANVGVSAKDLIDALHEIASSQFSRERAGHTLQPTAIVSEAWLRMMRSPGVKLESESQFRAWASKVVRNILVDHARSRRTQRRGGVLERVPIDLDSMANDLDASQVEVIHEALVELETIDRELVRIVELKFFGGLRSAEIGQLLGMTERQVRSQWTLARVVLRRIIMAEGSLTHVKKQGA